MDKIELKTGSLNIEYGKNLRELFGFAARENNKRGFLFVSMVLGKHIPCKPCEMQKIHKELADILRPKLENKPTVVIGFAETATGIGNGVYSQLKTENSFYIHTTRYLLNKHVLLAFQEEHCHAPSHILYDVEDENLRELLKVAENIVLVDDEITTGKTLQNIVKKLRKKFPNVKNYFAVSILNWMKDFPDDITFISLHKGNFSFEPKDFEISGNFISEPEEKHFLDEIIPYNFGRFGIKESEHDFSEYVDFNNLKEKKVLVLGTGEFMHQSFLLGKYLEKNGIDVYVQSTTRSPIITGQDIVSKINFKDNYSENIDNFLYNVIDKKYDKILICYETVSLPPNHNLKSILKNYFNDVEEIFLRTNKAKTKCFTEAT